MYFFIINELGGETMKLNHDCVRECLLYLEKNLEFAKTIDPNQLIEDLKYSKNDIFYSLQKLQETGYIEGGVTVSNTFTSCIYNVNPIRDISWEGHEYIDTIRDNKVWHKTKKVTASLKSVPLSMMKTIAAQVLIGLIKEKTGLPL
jgi:hypothetical protein